jgi:hypothetical protein
MSLSEKKISGEQALHTWDEVHICSKISKNFDKSGVADMCSILEDSDEFGRFW